ncbi:MAG: histidine phosphatase family protein [Micrococcales bacterium]
MPADRLHLVRHGEVHNPGGVLYGRLPHFHLSDRGTEMAKLASDELASLGRPIKHLVTSPLLRTQQSAAPVAESFGLDALTDERLIEPYNVFEGRKLGAGHLAIRPHLYYHLRNPQQPTWGEPYQAIADRMLDAMDAIAQEAPAGDAVLVSHQLPIWMVHLAVAGQKFPHNPRKRRCALSSITSFEKQDGRWVEVDYRDPGAALLAIDKGAV